MTENEQIKKQLEDKDKLIAQVSADRDEKYREIERLKYFIERIENDRKPLEKELEVSEQKRLMYKQVLAKYLKVLQEMCSKQKREHVASQSVRLGKLVYKRVGGQFKQVWEDGDELLQVKTQLEETIKEKESLEKLKRSKK